MILSDIIESSPTIKNYYEGKPLTAFFEITNRCNLKCRYKNQWFCYYYSKKQQEKELSDKRWLERLEQIKADFPSVYLASWIGGEPLIRKSLLKKILEKKLFPYNLIVTNGTIPLPKWDFIDLRFFYVIGMNGVKEQHEKIRGHRTYDAIKKNIEGHKNVILHFVVNGLNYQSIEKFVKEWLYSYVNIIGINFGFFTPDKDKKSIFTLSDKQRDEAVAHLLFLKKDYKDFILMSKREIQLSGSQEMKLCSDANCFYRTGSFLTFDCMGNRKYPCPLSPADCSKCSGTGQAHAIYREKDQGTIKTYQDIQLAIIKEVLT